VLRWSGTVANVSLGDLARPPRLFLGERKNLQVPPMRQLTGVEERRGSIVGSWMLQDGEIEELIVEQQ
jgi:hypothetical protein